MKYYKKKKPMGDKPKLTKQGSTLQVTSSCIPGAADRSKNSNRKKTKSFLKKFLSIEIFTLKLFKEI
jgi:hypothetical protein